MAVDPMRAGASCASCGDELERSDAAEGFVVRRFDGWQPCEVHLTDADQLVCDECADEFFAAAGSE